MAGVDIADGRTSKADEELLYHAPCGEEEEEPEAGGPRECVLENAPVLQEEGELDDNLGEIIENFAGKEGLR